jgi:hypothetical protein
VVYNGFVSTLAFAIASFVVMLALWAIGPEAMRDAGGVLDPDGRFRPWPDDFFADSKPARDKVLHAGCGALAMLVGVAFFRAPVVGAFLVVVIIGAGGWETAEWHPRAPYPGKRPGKWSWKDVVAGAVGAAVVGVVALMVGAHP